VGLGSDRAAAADAPPLSHKRPLPEQIMGLGPELASYNASRYARPRLTG